MPRLPGRLLLTLLLVLAQPATAAKKRTKKSTATGIARLADFHHEFWTTPTALAELKEYLERSRDQVLAVRDKVNHSALNIAAFKGNIDGVKALIAAGVDVNNPDANNHRPLHHAVLSPEPRPEIVQALLAAGARSGEQDKSGHTWSYYARKSKNTALLSLIK